MTNEGSLIKGHRTKGLKDKDLIGIPWMLAFALRADGWYLRQDIIWAKPDPMPESVKDRCTKSHEYVFLLSKSKGYYFDGDAIKEKSKTKPHAPGNKKLDNSRNDHDRVNKIWGSNGKRIKRDVWTIGKEVLKHAHFAIMPEELVYNCIKAGSKKDDIILDPFAGSGTVGVVAQKTGRKSILIDLNEDYCRMASKRIPSTFGMM